MQQKIDFPDEAIGLIKQHPNLNWPKSFSDMLFKELKETKLSEESARKLSDSVGKQIFSQIKEKFL